MRPVSVFASIVLLGFATTASAQIYTPPFNINHRIYVNTYDQQNANRGNSDNSGERTPVVRQASASSLNFRPSGSIRQQSYKKFVDQQRKLDPAGAQKTEQILASTDFVEQIGNAMRQMGLTR